MPVPAAGMPAQAAVNPGPPKSAPAGATPADAAAVNAAPGSSAAAAQSAVPAPGAVKGAAAQPTTARLLAVARPIPAPPEAVPSAAGDANAARRAPLAHAEEKSAAQLAAELKAARKQARQAKAEAERLAASSRGAERAAERAGAPGKAPGAAAGVAARSTAGAAAAAAGGYSAGAAATARTAKADGKAARGTDAAVQPGSGGVTVTSQQQGENAYRRGLAALQEGRVQEALSNMEQAVFLYPRHDTARQTLVGLLIENKRHDEAMRHLQFALGLDPRQPQMVMILARLQIEKGGPAIDTLQRSLPYAGGNGDYLAFLAGALQRAQRNREAAEQYQAALRLQPQNGVWWMGLGISLLAEKRNAEAQDAFTRAKNSGNLSQELQSFVERKLQQLAR